MGNLGNGLIGLSVRIAELARQFIVRDNAEAGFAGNDNNFPRCGFQRIDKIIAIDLDIFSIDQKELQEYSNTMNLQ